MQMGNVEDSLWGMSWKTDGRKIGALIICKLNV